MCRGARREPGHKELAVLVGDGLASNDEVSSFEAFVFGNISLVVPKEN